MNNHAQLYQIDGKIKVVRPKINDNPYKGLTYFPTDPKKNKAVMIQTKNSLLDSIKRIESDETVKNGAYVLSQRKLWLEAVEEQLKNLEHIQI